jgi:hypothetical protein
MLGDDVGWGNVGEMLSECWAIIGYCSISNLQLPAVKALYQL